MFVIDTSKAEVIQDIYKEIIKELRLDCIEHDRNSILKNSFLQGQRYLLVFAGIKEKIDQKVLIHDLIAFLIKMTEHTQYIKIIFMINNQNLHNLPPNWREDLEALEVEHLTREEAADHLQTLLRSEGKLALIQNEPKNKEEFLQLAIFEVWEKMNFRKEFAHQIIRKLDAGRTLQSIANEVKMREENKIEIN